MLFANVSESIPLVVAIKITRYKKFHQFIQLSSISSMSNMHSIGNK